MFDPHKVLIVDDEPIVRQLVERCLAPIGFEVCQAEDGHIALAQLEDATYGIVVLDLMMPGIKGMEVLNIIQARWPQIKVIILTANASLEAAIKALRSGAYDFVTKPFSVDEIRATVHRAAEKLRLEARLNAVYNLSRELGLSQNVDQVAEKVFDIAGSVLDLEACNLFLFHSDEGELVLYDAAYSQTGASAFRLPLTDETSITAAAARSGAPVYVPDFEGETVFVPADFGLRAELAVPLLVHGEVIGVLDVTSVQPGAFGADDGQMLSTLAAQAAVAIENARLYERISRSLAERRLMSEVILAAASTLDFDEVLARVLRTIHHVLGTERLSFMLPDESGKYLLTHRSCIGPPQDDRIPIEGTLEGRVYTGGEPTLVHYTRDVERRGSHLAVPVRAGDQIIAVLNAEGTRPNAFNEDDLRVFQAIANQLSVVLENARLYEAERELRHLVEQSRAQLVQSEKLAATGRMAASMAHEINNPLQAIHNSLQFMLTFPMSPEEARQYLQMANEEVERLMDMTSRILEFARPSRQEMQPIDLTPIIRRVLTLTGKFIQHNNIVVDKALAPELPPVPASPGELEQVLLNLVINAVEAMPDGGKLSVVSQVVNEGVEICVADTGCGISTEHMAHIFEPFYSTKEEGTGLGLSVSHSVIQRHEGRIHVESTVGKGTRFTLWLPLDETPVE